MLKKQPSSELKNISYELFIAALSVLSIFNLFFIALLKQPDVDGVLKIINIALSIIFFADFLYRLITTSAKSKYFFRQYGWADLLASLPFSNFKILRVFRLVRVVRLLRAQGVTRVFASFISARGSSALLTLFFIAILVFEFGGILILAVERSSPTANIKTSSDALWWIMTTVTTVGYGDKYPVTNPGRLVGSFVMIVGIGLFGTLTGFLANAFLEPKKK